MEIAEDGGERRAEFVGDGADEFGLVFDGAREGCDVTEGHNRAALGTREAAPKLGLSVPAGLSLVGYDDSRIARLRGIELTSMDLHALELGREAGAAALARLADPSGPVVDRRLEARLMVRGSTAPPPAA